MRYHEATTAGRWRKIILDGSLVLLGLTAAGLPDSHAQMSYSGGFIPKRRNPPEKTTPQPSASQPAAPKTPPAYSPDNDLAYPSSYLGGPKTPLPPTASLLPYNILPSSLPWNQADFEDYNELPLTPRDSSIGEAKKYSLSATLLPPPPVTERSVTAVLIAHLPEHAALWVQGIRTRSIGRTRYFQSPQLIPGRKYNYRVRAAWIEDGRWVSQTLMVPVEAGLLQAVYLQPTLPLPAKAAMNSRSK
jgi:uncharacterized protein (TIGR03000 family)